MTGHDEIELKEYTVSLPWFGIGRLIPYLKPYVKNIFIMVTFGIIGSGVDILMPLFQRYAINNFIANKTLEGLPWFVALYALVLTSTSFCNDYYYKQIKLCRVFHRTRHASGKALIICRRFRFHTLTAIASVIYMPVS